MSRSFDNITRSALWTSYNCVCFYCSKLLDWNDLHIDHIVPEYYFNDETGFKQIKNDYELDENFDINGIYNLVPVHSKCNLRKGDELFPKKTTLYYLGLTNKVIERTNSEIKKLRERKNKGQLISKLQSALANELINIADLEKILSKAKNDNWENAKIKLPFGVRFIDEIYDVFYLNTDCSILYDREMAIGGVNRKNGLFTGLELMNNLGEKMIVLTLRQWQEGVKKGFYPYTTYDIKMSSEFTFLEDFLEAMNKAQMPKISFISEPWLEIDNLDLLSPNVLHDFEGKINDFTNKGMSVNDLVKGGIVSVNKRGLYKVSLEYEGIETSLIEQFRADFNNDGVEDIFVRGWVRAVGGTMGYGFTTTLTRYSDKHLIEDINWQSKVSSHN